MTRSRQMTPDHDWRDDAVLLVVLGALFVIGSLL
jgi:hypothetical protein